MKVDLSGRADKSIVVMRLCAYTQMTVLTFDCII